MGFIKWVFQKYREYQMEEVLDRMEAVLNDDGGLSLWQQNFQRCIDAGLSREQIYALVNLISCAEIIQRRNGVSDGKTD